MPIQLTHPFRSSLLAATALGAGLAGGSVDAHASPFFNGVAAGDMTSLDAILWTRVDNGSVPVSLTAQVATDPAFSNVVWTGVGSTAAANDYTLKLDATGLTANTRYYYNFTNGSVASATGQFTTNPAPGQPTPFKVGFSGDADGRFRPYTSLAGFGTAANPGSQGLNAFIFLGDTIYETASKGSPAVPSLTPGSTPAQAQAALPVYNQKYLENISGVAPSGAISTSGGQQGLQQFLSSVGTYTLLDNHELGNKQLQSGGAPTAAASPNANPSYDVNTTGSYNNGTVAFQTLNKSFLDYHPTAATIDGTPTGGLTAGNLQTGAGGVVAPSDPRTNGAAQNYLARSWGQNATYIQLDDRSYRDVRLDVVGGPRADQAGRTMLGTTQLQWLEDQLLAAKASGSIWTVISVSTPIDQTGGNQDSKSWFGNYRAERNEILKFIADNGLQHVIFLTTDDHEIRTTQLQYEPDPVNKPGVFALVPGAFQILTGPIGAGGPDAVTDHSFANIQALLNSSGTGVDNNPDLIAHGDPLIGLVGLAGLSDVYRQYDPNAGGSPSSVDFFSPDKFGYTTLAFDQYGNLRVETWGINSYQQNEYLQVGQVPELIMAFSVAVPEPMSLAAIAAGLLGLFVARRRSR